MKAEPETRIEKGQDIKFSIDDLAAKNEPEPWDGNHLSPTFPATMLIWCQGSGTMLPGTISEP